MSSAVLGGCVGAGVCLAASPYLAGLVQTVPDRTDAHWWRATRVPRSAVIRVMIVGIVVGGLAGAGAGLSAALPALVVLALFGTPLVLIDLAVHRLPWRLTDPLALAVAVALVLAAAVTSRWDDLLRALAAALVVFAVLYLMQRTSGGGLGAGDRNLGGVVAGCLGWFGWAPVAYGFFAGFLLGALVSLVLMAARRATLKTAIPFGPMLLLGALVVLAFDLVPTAAP